MSLRFLIRRNGEGRGGYYIVGASAPRSMGRGPYPIVDAAVDGACRISFRRLVDGAVGW